MACKSPSVQKAAEKSNKAQEQVELLEKKLREKDESFKAEFSKKIDEYLVEAKISDATTLSYKSDIKTEYSSEFSLDKIANVVTSSLQAIKTVTDPKITNPAISGEAIDSYCNIVNTVAQAAKSSSKAAATMSFSATRLSSGIIAFLYASSVNIQSSDTFGDEAVSSTAIYHKIIQSIQDLDRQRDFDMAKERIINQKQAYKDILSLQALLIDSLKESVKSDPKNFVKYKKEFDLNNAAYNDLLEDIKKSIYGNANTAARGAALAIGLGSPVRKVLTSALSELSSMGIESYNSIIEDTQLRLKNGYY